MSESQKHAVEYWKRAFARAKEIIGDQKLHVSVLPVRTRSGDRMVRVFIVDQHVDLQPGSIKDVTGIVAAATKLPCRDVPNCGYNAIVIRGCGFGAAQAVAEEYACVSGEQPCHPYEQL